MCLLQSTDHFTVRRYTHAPHAAIKFRLARDVLFVHVSSIFRYSGSLNLLIFLSLW